MRNRVANSLHLELRSCLSTDYTHIHAAQASSGAVILQLHAVLAPDQRAVRRMSGDFAAWLYRRLNR
eukprot:46405-Prymnesium_polylepis.1